MTYVLLFSGDHCAPCRALKRDIDGHSAAKRIIHADQDLDEATLARYGVTAVPQIIAVDDTGAVVARLEAGYGGDKGEVLEFLRRYALIEPHKVALGAFPAFLAPLLKAQHAHTAVNVTRKAFQGASTCKKRSRRRGR